MFRPFWDGGCLLRRPGGKPQGGLVRQVRAPPWARFLPHLGKGLLQGLGLKDTQSGGPVQSCDLAHCSFLDSQKGPSDSDLPWRFPQV